MDCTEFVGSEIERLRRDAEKFHDSDMLSQLDCDDEYETEQTEENGKHVTPNEAALNFCSALIQNAVSDIRYFAELVQRYAVPPTRKRDRALGVNSLNTLANQAEDYETAKRAAAQALFWLMDKSRANALSFSFSECADALDCGKADWGLDGFRAMLLGKLPITKKLIEALQEYVEELEDNDTLSGANGSGHQSNQLFGECVEPVR